MTIGNTPVRYLKMKALIKKINTACRNHGADNQKNDAETLAVNAGEACAAVMAIIGMTPVIGMAFRAYHDSMSGGFRPAITR